MKVLKSLLYTEDHEWVKVEGKKAYIGITDYAQHALGAIVFIELPEVGEELEKGESFGVIESVKAASDSYMPIGGKIIEVNEQVIDDPGIVNSAPYQHWFIAIEVSDSGELDELLTSEAYKDLCEKEE